MTETKPEGSASPEKPTAAPDNPKGTPPPRDGAALPAPKPTPPKPAAAQNRQDPQSAKPPAPQPAPRADQAFAAGPIDLPPPESQRLFSGLTRASFLLLVLAPVAAAALYLLVFASDRYAVDVKFAIRSPDGIAATDMISLVTGGASGGTTQSDSYMVVDYLQSRQFLDEIAARIDLAAIYSRDGADFLYRLPPDASKEDRVDYLPRILSPYFDNTSQIITVEVQAFTPEDAERMASAVLAATADMVNRVSEKARADTVRLAESELARAEAALREQRALIARFRDSEQKIDPNRTAMAQEGVLADLETDLAATRAQMAGLREFLSADAPSIRVLQSRIASIEHQIAAERARLGSGSTAADPAVGDDLTGAVTRYEELAVDLDFLQRAYVSALSSVEAARLEADRQQRYVATFVGPARPETPRYPRVFLSLALVATTCFLFWSVLTMLLHVIREHLR